jgi:glycolate oxidase FAD binding subunit
MDYENVLGITPPTVIRPDTQSEVAAALVEAAGANHAVIPWGGGTGQTYGYVPARADVLLDLSGLNRVVAHEPGDLTVTVEAGVTLDTVQEALSQHNQFLPLDPPHTRTATVGGILATNAFGPGSAGYGTARDWLIGITVVDAQGRLVRGGGKVVKNVTGYDLPKLHVGALGTLGVIVEATFKVAPRPDASQPLLFVLPADDPSGGADLLARIRHETNPAHALLRDEAGSRVLILLYSGQEAVVAYEAQQAAEAGAAHGSAPVGSLPAGVRRPFIDAPAPDAVLVARVVGPPAGSCARHAAVSAMGLWSLVDTLPVTGHTDTYLRPDASEPEAAAREMIQWAEAHGGLSVTFPHAPLALRRDRSFPLWSPLPTALPLMGRLKETLDPAATLNPGRFVGGI